MGFYIINCNFTCSIWRSFFIDVATIFLYALLKYTHWQEFQQLFHPWVPLIVLFGTFFLLSGVFEVWRLQLLALSVWNSLSSQLITNIDMSVCAQGVKEPGRAFPTPTCHYLAPQFAPLILGRFLVGCRVKTNSLHSDLELKSLHLRKQGFLSRFGARLIPEWDSVHLSIARKFSQRWITTKAVTLLNVCLLFQEGSISWACERRWSFVALPCLLPICKLHITDNIWTHMLNLCRMWWLRLIEQSLPRSSL